VCAQLKNVEVWFQRASDVVRKLRSGDVDMGIVGYDMVREYGQVGLKNFSPMLVRVLMLKGPHVEGSFTICVIWLIIVQKVCCVCGDSLEIVESACVVVLKLDFKICCCFLVWTRTMRISSSFMMRLVLGNVILVLGYASCTLLPEGFSGRGRG
jgi:hypothetical protein